MGAQAEREVQGGDGCEFVAGMNGKAGEGSVFAFGP